MRFVLVIVIGFINLLIVDYFTEVEGTFLDLPGVYQVTAPVDHAEGPVWDIRKNILYYVDIHSGKILSYNYYTHELNSVTFHGDVAIIVPSKFNPDVLIVANNRSVLAVKWNGQTEVESVKLLTTVANNFPTSRFNDGKADNHGRLWFGTIGFENASGVVPNEGALYFITKDNLVRPSPIIFPVTVSNGLAWNQENTKFYYIDTPTLHIMAYDYDDKNGKIYNGNVAFNMTQYSNYITGFPDGMTIDTEDKLWIALYGGGAVIQIDPLNGVLLNIISIPAKYVTSVSFGGPNLNVMFVTTSRYVLKNEERKQQPGAGSVYAIVNTGSRGLPTFEADIF